MPVISVIIVNYNAGERLAKCLKHLTKQTFDDFEIIIADNGSSDQSIELAQNTNITAKYLLFGDNLGFAAGNNKAVAMQASGEWLAFLNPDAYAQEDWLAQLMKAVNKYPDADAFGSTQIDALDPSRIDGAGDVYHILGAPYRGHFGWDLKSLPAQDGECFAPCAAAALYRKKTFQALGGFDESFFCYGEDVDLGFRLRLAGGQCIQVKDAIVHHEGSGITGRHSDFSVYHGHRNRIWVGFKNTPALLYWPFLPLRLLTDLALLLKLMRQGAAIAYLRALRDGYRGLAARSKERHNVQKTRKTSTKAIARAFTWSPIKLMRRQADLKSISHDKPAP